MLGTLNLNKGVYFRSVIEEVRDKPSNLASSLVLRRGGGLIVAQPLNRLQREWADIHHEVGLATLETIPLAVTRREWFQTSMVEWEGENAEVDQDSQDRAI